MGDIDTAWTLIASDLFDRESAPQVDAKGTGLHAGLTELWRRVLTQGVRDGGQRTFTAFQLRCASSIELGVQPYDNHEYATLRGWVYGTPGPYEGGADDAREPRDREDPGLLDAVVRAHARLLVREEKVVPGWDAASAAGVIRACIARSTTPAELTKALADA